MYIYIYIYIYEDCVYQMCRSFTDHIFAYLYIRERLHMLIYVNIYIYDIPLTFVPKGGVDAPFRDKRTDAPFGDKRVCIYIYRERD